MGVEIPNGYAQASFVFSLAGKQGDIVWTLGLYDGEGGVFNPAAVCRTNWSAAGRPFEAAQMATGWTFQGVRVTLATPTGPQLDDSLIPVAGTSSSQETLPPNCAFLVRKQTNRGGRKGRGRAFWPPVNAGEQFVDQAGNLAASAVTMLNQRAAAAVAGMIADGLTPVLLHEDGSAPDPIISMVVQGTIATQRRRLR